MVLVFGGSFNPPTKAHVDIVKQLIENFNPKEVVLLPVGNYYDWKEDLAPFNNRYEMLRFAFRPVKKITISTLENTRDFLGTYTSLKKLESLYTDIYFVLGTDHLKTIEKWKDYELLLKEYSFVVITRKNYEADFSVFDKHNTKYLTFSYDSEISSTRIRNDIEKYKDDLEEKVYNYIVKNGLYKKELT